MSNDEEIEPEFTIHVNKNPNPSNDRVVSYYATPVSPKTVFYSFLNSHPDVTRRFKFKYILTDQEQQQQIEEEEFELLPLPPLIPPLKDLTNVYVFFKRLLKEGGVIINDIPSPYLILLSHVAGYGKLWYFNNNVFEVV
jgi:hypothetical protein